MRTFKRKDNDEKERDAFLGKLAEQYVVPPFSVLDRRSQRWKDRRKKWAFLPSDICGRGDGLTWGKSEFMRQFSENGTSSFDPFLAELMYSWFCPENGRIYDPFSGGVTRGAVAASMGLDYLGNDLRPEQVESNRKRWGETVVPPSVYRCFGGRIGEPVWLCGDSVEYQPEESAFDFVFSSPPYNDTEPYSDDPRCLTTMDESGFYSAFGRILEHCYKALKPNRFLALNVGNTRDSRTGAYRDLHGAVIRLGQEVGFAFWNDLVVIDPIASKVLQADRGFSRYRRCPHVHQYVVVLLKGDPVLAANRTVLDAL